MWLDSSLAHQNLRFSSTLAQASTLIPAATPVPITGFLLVLKSICNYVTIYENMKLKKVLINGKFKNTPCTEETYSFYAQFHTEIHTAIREVELT